MAFAPLGPDIKPIFVARQPIYDEKERVFAYELLFRHTGSSVTSGLSPEEADTATATVIADGFTLAFNGTDRSKKAFINFPQRLLQNDSVYALPRDICVIEVQGPFDVTAELITALKDVKERGYTVALDSYTQDGCAKELLPYVDIVKVDVLSLRDDALRAAALSLKQYSCALLAQKVESREAYRTASSLGFTLFQGFLFSRPEMITGSKAPIPAPTKFKLLQILVGDDFDIREATSALSSDPALCYRLLNFINSACFSLRAKIQSIQQAMTLLGRQKLRHWLLAVIISEFGVTPRIREAAYTSLQRAHYLEALADLYNHPMYPPESMFLLGLFSKLDVLLGQPMQELLKKVLLTSGLEKALLGEASPYRGWLALVEDIEGGRWHEVDAFLAFCQMDHEQASRCYAESTNWANSVVQLTGQN